MIFLRSIYRSSLLLLPCLLISGFICRKVQAQSPAPAFVVTTAEDNTSGSPGNCTDQSQAGAMPDSSCSLRDALAASQPAGGNISFSSTVFGANQSQAARTITLINGVLTVPSNTSISGPISGSGASQVLLVSVSGNVENIYNGATAYTVFSVTTGSVNVSLANLNIINGTDLSPQVDGGGIANDGELLVTNCVLSGSVGDYSHGIFNDIHGVLKMMNSLLTNNASRADYGGGIDNRGSATVINTTISMNTADAGGGIANDSESPDTTTTLVVANSTITQNTAQAYPGTYTAGGGIEGGGLPGIGTGSLTITNSLISNNVKIDADCCGPHSPVEDDCSAYTSPSVNICPATGTGGNLLGAGLTAGTPGASAICAGLVADIPADVTTDQRGLPRTSTYATASGNVSCVDSGAIQSHFSLDFTQQPPASVTVSTPFTAAVGVQEGSLPLKAAGTTVTLSLDAEANGALTNGTAQTDATGTATFSQLGVSETGTGDTLTATIPVTSTYSVSTVSSAFNVMGTAQTITFPALPTPVVFGAAPISLAATASSGLPVSYTVTGPGVVNGSSLAISGAGTIMVTASQAGNESYAAATPVSQTVAVNRAVTTTALSSSSTSANQGASVTFTSVVTSTAGVPTGAVQFLDGTTSLGSSPLNSQGLATFSTTSLAIGSHTIQAIYSGDQNFSGSQASTSQTITAPAISVSASATSLTLRDGQSGTLTITLTPSAGLQGALQLTCSGAPQNASCALNPTSLTADGSGKALTAQLTVTTSGPHQGSVSELHPGPFSGSGVEYAWLPAGLAAFLLFCGKGRRPGTRLFLIIFALLCTAGFGLSGCGGGSSSTSTPAGTSTLTVNVTGPNVSQSIAVTLNVTH